MRKTPATVLSVSPAEEVHFSLQEIFNHSIWKLHKTHSLPSALAVIRAQTIPWFFAKPTCCRAHGRIWWSRSRALPIPRPSS